MGVDTTITPIPIHPKTRTADDCVAMAESGGGAFSFDVDSSSCWKVYGKEVKIEELQDSIMKGFQIVNMNFAASSASAPAVSPSGLPGPKNNIPASPAINAPSTPVKVG